MSVFNVSQILEKTTHYDKDERYMATSDLCNELQKDVKLDPGLERRVCVAVLNQLDDTSNDVQSIAVKCLGVLVTKVQENQVAGIADKLCSLLLTGKPELRDIYSIGLKTLITDAPESMGACFAPRLSHKLLSGIAQDKAPEVKLESLDTLTDLIKRFGHEIRGDHEQIMDTALVQLLSSSTSILRKRSTACLGALAVVLSDPLLNRLAETLLAQTEKPPEDVDVRVLIQTVGAMARSVGHRLGRQLCRILPLFLRVVGQPDMDDHHNDAANELRENCFQAFESLVLRCHGEVRPHIPALLSISLQFMKYDPNYSYDDSEGEQDFDGDGDGQDDFSEDEEEEDFSDDDDTSWKVRRAALRVLVAIIRSRPELLKEINEQCATELISRFKEREESVRIDVINAMAHLLRALRTSDAHTAFHPSVDLASASLTSSSGAALSGVDAQSREELQQNIFFPFAAAKHREHQEKYKDFDQRPCAASPSSSSSSSSSLSSSSTAAAKRRQSANVKAILTQVPQLIRAADRQLQPKVSAKVKSSTFEMLRQLTLAVPGQLEDFLGQVLPSSVKILQDRNSSLKLEALCFLRLALASHSPSFCRPFVSQLVPPIVECIREDWYKIIAEALRVAQCLIHIIRPITFEEKADVEPQFKPYIQTIYDAVLPRLEANDIDQEIKECAITTMGSLVSHFGDLLEPQLSVVFPLVLDRLKNEITRMPAMKAIAAACSSPLNLDLSIILAEAVGALSLFLRQQSRTLKQVTLTTLNYIAVSTGSTMADDAFAPVVQETAELISDADLHLSHLALDLTVSVVEKSKTPIEAVQQHILPKALELSCSPLLQGGALQSLLHFYRELVKLDLPSLSFDFLLSQLLVAVNANPRVGVSSLVSSSMDPSTRHGRESASGPGMTERFSEPLNGRSEGSGVLAKQSIANLARCIAAVCLCTSEDKCKQTVAMFVTNVDKSEREGASGVSESLRHVSLLSLGEIGKKKDLSYDTAIQKSILSAFESGGEETKAAAAYALGSVCVGNMARFLPVVFEALGTGKNEYLLLSALKEIISCHVADPNLDFSSYLEEVYSLLVQHCECGEEGVRNMVAECLGKLSIIAPTIMLPKLQNLCFPGGEGEGREEEKLAVVRWTAITALKFCVTSEAPAEELRSRLPHFLQLLGNQDLNVRRAALVTLNSIAHHQSYLLLDSLSKVIVPTLLETIDLKMERTVDLGPFKHKVDDGLPLRKAAFACIDTLLDTCSSKIDIPNLLPALKKGLSDQDDVQILAHQILAKVCAIQPGAILTGLDSLIEPLEKTINRKPKSNQVGTELERVNDLIRSAMRAIYGISLTPDVGSDRKLLEFLDRIENNPKLAALLHSVKTEREGFMNVIDMY